MEPIYIRELAAWVLVWGLGVTLVTSKIKERRTNSKNSPKKASKAVVLMESTPTGKNPFKEIYDAHKKEEPEFIETPLEGQAAEAGRIENGSMEQISKPAGEPGPERRGVDKVSGSPDRAAKVRRSTHTVKNGPPPHKGKGRPA